MWGFFIILLFLNFLYLPGHSETTRETKVVTVESLVSAPGSESAPGGQPSFYPG